MTDLVRQRRYRPIRQLAAKAGIPNTELGSPGTDGARRREYYRAVGKKSLNLHYMTRQIIRTPAAPDSTLFSQAIKVGSRTFCMPPTRAIAKLGVELPNVLVSIKMTAILWDESLSKA